MASATVCMKALSSCPAQRPERWLSTYRSTVSFVVRGRRTGASSTLPHHDREQLLDERRSPGDRNRGPIASGHRYADPQQRPSCERPMPATCGPTAGPAQIIEPRGTALSRTGGQDRRYRCNRPVDVNGMLNETFIEFWAEVIPPQGPKVPVRRGPTARWAAQAKASRRFRRTGAAGIAPDRSRRRPCAP